jgi:hypothetical protein
MKAVSVLIVSDLRRKLVSAIIKYDQIILITEDSNNRRGWITMYKIKLFSGTRSGLIRPSEHDDMTP